MAALLPITSALASLQLGGKSNPALRIGGPMGLMRSISEEKVNMITPPYLGISGTKARQHLRQDLAGGRNTVPGPRLPGLHTSIAEEVKRP